MDTDDLAVAVLSDLMGYIEAEVESIVFDDYMRDLRKGKPNAMGKYASRMSAVKTVPPSIVDGKWESSIDIPYKAPTRGGEYKQRRSVEYTRNPSSGKYGVSASYGIGRLTSMVDRVVEKGVLRLADDKKAVQVKIIREKI